MNRAKLQLHGKSAARCQMQSQPAVLINPDGFLAIILGLLIGIHTVFKQNSRIRHSFGKEREIELHITFIPTGHTADIPVHILLTHCYNIFSQLARSNKSRIHLHRQRSYEIHTFLLIQIVGRRITQHGKRRIVYNIGSQLMTPGSHAGRCVIHGAPICLRGIAHSSRRIIHRSRHHTDIGESNIIKRHIILDIRPFHLFHAEHAFKIDNMRVGTVDTCRFVNAVQIKG